MSDDVQAKFVQIAAIRSGDYGLTVAVLDADGTVWVLTPGATYWKRAPLSRTEPPRTGGSW